MDPWITSWCIYYLHQGAMEVSMCGRRVAGSNARSTLRLCARLGTSFWIFLSLTCALFAQSGTDAGPPGNAPSDAERQAKFQNVEVAIFGNIRDMRGVQWPKDQHGHYALSAGIAKECDVTIHLPGGNVLSLRTRPVLILERAIRSDTVMAVNAPPAGTHGTLLEKAHEVEQLLSKWNIKPDARLLAGLREWEKPPQPAIITLTAATQPATAPATSPATLPSDSPRVEALRRAFDHVEPLDLGGMMRIGMDLDEQTQIYFRVQGSQKSGWYLVVEITAKAGEWARGRAPTETDKNEK